MAGRSRPKDAVASARLCPAINGFLVAMKTRHGCPAERSVGHDQNGVMIERCDTSGSATTPSLDGHFDAVVLSCAMSAVSSQFRHAAANANTPPRDQISRKPVAAVATS